MLMAMGTERSKALHNFTMPCGLRWGNQRFLRCMKVNSDGQISPLHRFNNSNSSAVANHHPIQQRRTTRDRDRDRERDKDSSFHFLHGSHKLGPTPPPPCGRRRFSDVGDDDDDDDGIAATREKVMFDLQTAADKMKNAIFFKDGIEEGEVSISPPPPPPLPAAASSEGETYCPWNLRTRRAACRMQVSGYGGPAAASGGGNEGGGVKGLKVDAPRPNSGISQMRAGSAAAAATPSLQSPIHRSDGNGTAASGEKKERPKFSVALSKRDIEEDFYAMVRHRPPRRPKKRAKTVQKQLDTLFPGLWLTEVTPDMYKVIESAP